MWRRLNCKKSTLLCFACLLALTTICGVAGASRTLIIHVEDESGNAILDSQVTMITSQGEYLKTVQMDDGIYAPYELAGKVTIEIEHLVYGRTYVEINLDEASSSAGTSDGGELHKTVVLGQDLLEQASSMQIPPENDDCADAIPLAVPSVMLGTTSDATDDPEADAIGTCGSAIYSTPGVWYSVIGTGTTMTAETCGEFYDFDTKITVFCGPCGELACIDGNDDNCPDGVSSLLSSVSWCAEEGAEYLILVHGFGGQTGDFRLSISEDGVPCTPDVPCAPRGACCLPDGSCADGLTQAECEGLGGLYQGFDAACAGWLIGWDVSDCANPFEDISGTGTQLPFGDDDGEVVPLGFDFNFWNVVHDMIGVSSNGYLTFGTDLTDFSNDPLPYVNDPNDLIAPLWDDLDLRESGAVHYQTLGTEPNRYFIAQWTEVPEFGDEVGSNTFQAVLYEGTNCIEFRYGEIKPESYEGDYTIGVESPDGAEGLAIASASVYEGVCKSLCPELADPIACSIRIFLDINPASCPNPLNTNSKGVLPVAILGTDYFDVTTIDPATIELEGVAPLRWSIEDVATPFDGEECGCTEEGPDGNDDLTLKFKTQEIVGALNSAAVRVREQALLLNTFEERLLTLTAVDMSGAPIEATDCVRVIHRSNGPDEEGETSDPGAISQVITETSLGGGYPNPFTSNTRITFSLPRATHVSLVVYDVSGRRVRTLVNGEVPGGSHSASWDRTDEAGRQLPAGVYFVRMSAQGFDKRTKLIVAQ